MLRTIEIALNAVLALTAVAIAIVNAPHARGADVMAEIADGSPWSMQGENGRNGKITLNPDGSGQLKMGPFTMGASWYAEPGGFCLSPNRGDTRCVTVERVGGGFVGSRDGAIVMRLTR